MKSVLILAAALAAVAVAASAQPPAGGPPMGGPPGAAGGAGGPGGPGGAGGRGPAPFDPTKPLAGCTRCHGAIGRDGNLTAPDLKGIYGAKVAGHADFAGYSDALKAKGGTWDDKSLDSFLKDSKADTPGTKMNQKLPDDQRAIVIAYLKTYK